MRITSHVILYCKKNCLDFVLPFWRMIDAILVYQSQRFCNMGSRKTAPCVAFSQSRPLTRFRSNCREHRADLYLIDCHAEQQMPINLSPYSIPSASKRCRCRFHTFGQIPQFVMLGLMQRSLPMLGSTPNSPVSIDRSRRTFVSRRID